MLKRNTTARPSGTSVAKWGAIRIPKSVMSEANLREGDAVEFEVKSPGIIVVPASHSQPNLQDLIAGITPRNRHKETTWGKPRGNEMW